MNKQKRATAWTDYCGLEQATLNTTTSSPPLLDNFVANVVP